METIANSWDKILPTDDIVKKDKNDTLGSATYHFELYRKFPSDRRHVKLGRLLKEHFSDERH